MNPMREIRPFPVPVVSALGPGGMVEDETLDYIAMPQGMAMYQPPILPEPEDIAACEGAVRVLQQVRDALQKVVHGGEPQRETVRSAPAGVARKSGHIDSRTESWRTSDCRVNKSLAR